MYATSSSTQEIINELHQHIVKQGGRPADWYVGIANHTDRLFVDHAVDRAHGWWVYKTCPDSATARAVEKAFLDWGCKGGGGGGGDDTVIVYTYLITNYTRE